MTSRLLVTAAFGAALVVPAQYSAAESIKGRWSVALQGGTDLELSGNVHEGGRGAVLGLPTDVSSRSFSDIYDRSLRGQLAIGYGVGERSELFVRGSYYKADSITLPVGTVAGLGLNADFGEYREWGLEGGYRYHLSDSRLRPYVGVMAGLRSIKELPSTFSVPAANVVLPDVPFFDRSTAGVFGADLGLAYEISSDVWLGLETGPRYQTKPSRLNGLAGTGLEPINDTGSRWSMPLVASLKFQF